MYNFTRERPADGAPAEIKRFAKARKRATMTTLRNAVLVISADQLRQSSSSSPYLDLSCTAEAAHCNFCTLRI